MKTILSILLILLSASSWATTWTCTDVNCKVASTTYPDGRNASLLVTSIPSTDTIDPYIAPPTPVPQSVLMWKAQIALSRAGSLGTVEAYLVDMAGQAGVEARIKYAKSTTVERDHALVEVIRQVLVLTNAQMDDLFITADAIQ